MRRGSKCTLSATSAAVHMLKHSSYLCKKALKVRDLFIIAFLGVVSGTQRHKNPAEADSPELHLLLQSVFLYFCARATGNNTENFITPQR